MLWEQQSGRYPLDMRLGHRPGRCYIPGTRKTNNSLCDLYTTTKGFISLESDNRDRGYDKDVVVVLGGSSAMGLGATSNESTICGQLQKILDKALPNQYDVINAACGGYASWQELLRFSLEISGCYKPSFVFSVSGWNDFFYSSIGDRYYGKWAINHDRSIDDLSDRFLEKDFKKVVKGKLVRSKLYQLVKSHYFRKNGLKLSPQEIRWGYDSIYFHKRPKAASNYVHNMEQIRFLSQCIGADFKCYLQPVLDASHLKHQNNKAVADLQRRYQLCPELPIAQAAYYNQLEKLTGSKSHYQLLNYAHEMFADHCHLNDQGQEKLAGALARHILR